MNGETVGVLHESETLGDEFTETGGSLLFHSEANMTNCYTQCKRFFQRYESINIEVLIGYWMMAGHLGPVYSVENAYQKGESILLELIDQEGVLKYSDEDKEMIELRRPTYSRPIRCRHQGLCASESLQLAEFLGLDKIGHVELTDGIVEKKKKKKKKGSVDLNNGNYQSKKFYPSKNKELKYSVGSNPRPDSLKPLLKNIKEPTALILRGCESALQADFPFDKFTTLNALEISGLTHLPSFLESTISRMSSLHSLNLYDLPIKKLGIDFRRLRSLRQLILIGSFSIPTKSLHLISQLTKLEFLDLSGHSIVKLPQQWFAKLTELRWVILRGCSKLRSLPFIKPLTKLEALDLSHCSSLEIETGTLENSHIRMLDLSFTALNMRSIPAYAPYLTHLFLRGAKVVVLNSLKHISRLEVLDLSGAQYVKQVKQLGGNKNLVVLDLSRTGIRNIEFLSNLIQLRQLKLRECTGLETLPTMIRLTKLEVLDISGCLNLCDLPEDLSNLKSMKELDISGCRGLKRLRKGLLRKMSCLEKLDLSNTRASHLPSFANLKNLRKLSLRDLKLDSLETLSSLSNLVELDLAGLTFNSINELKLDFLESLVNLQILNISETSVPNLTDMSKLLNLKELLLANCQKLKLLPELHTLTNLETLDLSLPKETESKAREVQLLSAPSNLRKLVLTNRPGVLIFFPLTSLGDLEYLDIRGTGEIDFVRAHSSKMERLEEVVGWDSYTHRGHVEGRSSKADEFLVVSTFYQSGFHRFRTEFTELDKLISNIQMKVNSVSPDTIAKAYVKNQAFKRHFASMPADLEYLRQQVSLLESSHNSKSSEELLHELMDATTHLSANDFPLDSTNLNALIRLVLKLKLLLPTQQLDEWEASETTKEKKLWFTRSKNKEKVATDSVEDPDGTTTDHLWNDESLTDMERNCLLCFALFPCSKGKSLVIKKRMLIHWWDGEKFFDGLHERTAGEVPTIEMLDKSKTTNEIGRVIFESLEKRGFIKTEIIKGRDSGRCSMEPFMHSFIVEQAKEKGFFDFTRGKRVCLLKSQDNFPSSCKLGRNYTSSSEGLAGFTTIRAMLNVNEPIIDVKAEWFSKMKDLLVLYLGSWGFEDGGHIEFADQKFLDDLKSMKQLRLLSLQGFSAITKLPNSVCKLTNLRILDIRDCGYLEELPADIGSLKNLIYLDITHCRLLSKVPKGVSSLSKIEVLKGFVISYQGGGQEHRKACILRDLLKLEKLKKLNLLVNSDKFPSNEDLQVFRKMKSLSNLKITWEKSYSEYQESWDVVGQKGSTHLRLQQLMCWKQQTHQNDREEFSGSHLGNLKKLVLCCFPSETAPTWLNPSELKNLEKLYIVGGHLTDMPGTNENTWNVKILRFKYLRKLNMSWPVLRDKFPRLRYLENHHCDMLTHFPCVNERVWTIERQRSGMP